MYLLVYITLPHLMLKTAHRIDKADIIISVLGMRKLRQNDNKANVRTIIFLKLCLLQVLCYEHFFINLYNYTWS